jgi:hypothetical protein
MAAGEAHVLQLEASLLGNPAVAAKVVLAFTVELDGLMPLISGGGVQVRAVRTAREACRPTPSPTLLPPTPSGLALVLSLLTARR